MGRILLYKSSMCCEDSILKGLQNIGCQIDVLSGVINDYDKDAKIQKAFLSYFEQCYLQGITCDGVFSVDYYPVISRICQTMQIPYISWLVDCPMTTMYSKTINNSCNAIFAFDREQYIELKSLGVEKCWHMPLATDLTQWDNIVIDEEDFVNYKSDVSFLGNLYNDEKSNPYSTIKGLPEYLQGFFKALIDSQLNIYGTSIIDVSLKDRIFDESKKYININLGDSFYDVYKEMLSGFLYTEVSRLERKNVLSMLGSNYNLKIYTSSDTSELTGDNITYGGYLDYLTQMPKVFKLSKVNINITSKSIKSGISLRVLDVLGAGGFLITNYQTEISEFFEDGKELVMYESLEDLNTKVAYYLKHDEERKTIAAAGHEKVKKLFSYELKLKEIMEAVYG